MDTGFIHIQEGIHKFFINKNPFQQNFKNKFKRNYKKYIHFIFFIKYLLNIFICISLKYGYIIIIYLFNATYFDYFDLWKLFF